MIEFLFGLVMGFALGALIAACLVVAAREPLDIEEDEL